MTDANLQNSRKKDKAAALLALIADEREKRGLCLSPGQMAALIDNTCVKEERAVFMDHLSRCERCYGEWLTLKKMDDRQTGLGQKSGRVYRFSKGQKYSFIGSVLALAASVAVYLNISPLPDTFLDRPLEEQTLVQPERSAEPLDDGTREQPQIPETATPSLKKLPKSQTLQALPPSPGVAKKMVRQESAGAAGVPVDVDSWLAHVEEHCRAGNQDMQFWAKMHLQGKTMLAQQADLLPRDKAEKVSAALLLLGEMGPAAVTEQCRLLLDLLAEDEKNRQEEPSQ